MIVQQIAGKLDFTTILAQRLFSVALGGRTSNILEQMDGRGQASQKLQNRDKK